MEERGVKPGTLEIFPLRPWGAVEGSGGLHHQKSNTTATATNLARSHQNDGHDPMTLGGFLGRKSDGEPGTETIWRGLQRLDDVTEMYAVMRREN